MCGDDRARRSPRWSHPGSSPSWSRCRWPWPCRCRPCRCRPTRCRHCRSCWRSAGPDPIADPGRWSRSGWSWLFSDELPVASLTPELARPSPRLATTTRRRGHDQADRRWPDRSRSCKGRLGDVAARRGVTGARRRPRRRRCSTPCRCSTATTGRRDLAVLGSTLIVDGLRERGVVDRLVADRVVEAGVGHAQPGVEHEGRLRRDDHAGPSAPAVVSWSTVVESGCPGGGVAGADLGRPSDAFVASPALDDDERAPR